jgi:hypothetical protein
MYEYRNVVDVTIDMTANFELMQNYPNPFNPTTTINYQLPIAGYVSLKVFDMLGREIASLIDEKQSAGIYTVEFDGSKLASGVYFYKLHTESGFNKIRKLLLMK